MKKQTLGGDGRLGTGDKMQVELTGYQRSHHDLSKIMRTSMSAGTLVPFLNEINLPGGRFEIDLDVDVKTLPTVGPLFGSFKVQLDIFQTPMRLYNSLLHMNKTEIGLNMSQVKIPQIELTAQPLTGEEMDIDNSQINPSSIMAYLGLRGIGRPGATSHVRQFNAIPLLNYWDIYKNYYSNKQEQ
jgi:hypothetical protein